MRQGFTMNKFSLTKTIDDHIANSRGDHQPSDNFYATELGSCSRKAVLRRARFEPEPFDERTLRVFKVGEILHKFVQDILKIEGLLVATEEPAKQWGISGRIDAVVEVEGRNILFEIKSVNSRKFSYLNSESDPHYYMQTTFYQMVLQEKYNFSSTRLIYLSKDDLRIKEIEIPVERWKPKVEENIKELQEAWENWKNDKVLPDVLEKGNWKCKYCNLKSACKKGG